MIMAFWGPVCKEAAQSDSPCSHFLIVSSLYIHFHQRTRYVLARLYDSDKIWMFPYQVLGICVPTPSSKLMHANVVPHPWHLIGC